MDARRINQSFDLVSYASRAVTLHKSGCYFIGACPMCGGHDRFQIKRTSAGDLWICRKCQPVKYHSVIDFFMVYHQEGFTEALKRVGTDTKPLEQKNSDKTSVRAPIPLQLLPSAEWQAAAWNRVESASNRLMGNRITGLLARQYLAERGLSRGSIFRNWLGFAVIYGRPSIVIPWLDSGDAITAVKYRFIDDLAQNDKGKRFLMMAGSLPFLFGVQHILASDDILLFVEGELNAISLIQIMPRGISIVSAGADTNGSAALLRALARRYTQAAIWMDDVEKARATRDRMNRPEARILKSPFINGIKYDANQMLQAGLLESFVVHEFSTVCDSIPTSGDAEKV